MTACQSPKPFTALDFDSKQSIIFLDVDGTLLPDGEWEAQPAVQARVRALTENNDVYVTTNTRNEKRKEAMVRLFGVAAVPSTAKKPSRQVAAGVMRPGRAAVVIGDKFLTDELFARRIGARFIRVARLHSARERWGIRMINLIDDACHYLFHVFFSSYE